MVTSAPGCDDLSARRRESQTALDERGQIVAPDQYGNALVAVHAVHDNNLAAGGTGSS